MCFLPFFQVEFVAEGVKMELIEAARSGAAGAAAWGKMDFHCREPKASDPITFTTRDSHLVSIPTVLFHYEIKKKERKKRGMHPRTMLTSSTSVRVEKRTSRKLLCSLSFDDINGAIACTICLLLVHCNPINPFCSKH